MELTREQVITHIEQAEAAYANQQNRQLESHIVAIQENFDALEAQDQGICIRYYRLYMRFLTLFEQVKISAMQTYLEALETEGVVEASDYELICSFYKLCPQEIYEKALIAYSYNETLHIHYALKLKEERRFTEAIEVVDYVLECYPGNTECRFLLWEIKQEYLDELCNAEEEIEATQLLSLASATHHKSVLKGLELDPRLTPAEKYHVQIQLAVWGNRSVENRNQWRAEWQHVELADQTRDLLADYAKAFMMYDMVDEVLKFPEAPHFPEENYTDFSGYRAYILAVTNAGWQRAQHHYLLIGKSCYHYSKDLKKMAYCLQQGLELHPKNPLLLELKGKFFFFQGDYEQAAAGFNEAFKQGLSATDFLQTSMDLNDRVKNSKGILQTVNQFHQRHFPNAKSTCFRGIALVKLGFLDQAFEVFTEGIENYPQSAFHAWMYYWRAVIHKHHKNYDLMLKDIQSEVKFYPEGSSDYCNSMNLCMASFFEKGDYKKSHQYGAYCFEQRQLDADLHTVLKWICFYNYLPKPKGLEEASEADLITNPASFIDYRNNGLTYWMIGNYTEAINSLLLAAEKDTEKGLYYQLAYHCARLSPDKEVAVRIYRDLVKEVPEARNWEIDISYTGLLEQTQNFKEAKEGFLNFTASYPYEVFYNFAKHKDMVIQTLKESAKGEGNLKDYTRYSAVLLSKENPNESYLKEHQQIAEDFHQEDLFLRHNLLARLARFETEDNEEEFQKIKNLKAEIIQNHFA
ncbi:tetratricopeptide repeat protein [Mesonia aestuariivivens]|uniref:Tetratricopeptide repeat protein n=1 Tax=Mesonia aestuariivivens TaxID=2796128 RepID=A0ABS6VYA2_9FLAO|nr:hypothetical protein [Mesonia aestuariivivens]MBW2960562.1 hypothetical protein [Mesonia aestuariivivens]